MEPDIPAVSERICSHFIRQRLLSAVSLADGHINDTSLITAADGKYVLQRLQKGMEPEKLEHNYRIYSQACEDNKWCYPKWLPVYDNKNSHFFTDENGDNWRMYPFIDGEILVPPLLKDELYACGYGLARMHGILNSGAHGSGCVPQAVYPHLHDLNYYFDRYTAALHGGDLYERNRDRMIEVKIGREIGEHLESSMRIRENSAVTVIHGDPKIANIVFRDGRVAGFIDLDTVMTGAPAEDIADCIRSCCVSHPSDGYTVLDKAAAEKLLDGYLCGMTEQGGDTGQDMIRSVPDAFNKICFELGMRYYTDAVSVTGRVFHEKYDGYFLDRARELIGLKWQ